ncbi:hypothetical protein EVAR_6065_1 [Eumeta japonica]|uniref:Uncharacterized protein n=1 Tax=Eumeta variegata TaxID=151549 RepID=A0A4C1T9Q7_EUMVA|nr:hypothetical protein EVAR_6065_1 [Eumeta japonica]
MSESSLSVSANCAPNGIKLPSGCYATFPLIVPAGIVIWLLRSRFDLPFPGPCFFHDLSQGPCLFEAPLGNRSKSFCGLSATLAARFASGRAVKACGLTVRGLLHSIPIWLMRAGRDDLFGRSGCWIAAHVAQLCGPPGLVHQNIQGVKNKELEVELFMDSANIDILCITKKIKCVRFSLLNVKNGSGSILIRNEELELVDTTVFLGLTLDNKLQWDSHILIADPHKGNEEGLKVLAGQVEIRRLWDDTGILSSGATIKKTRYKPAA